MNRDYIIALLSKDFLVRRPLLDRGSRQNIKSFNGNNKFLRLPTLYSRQPISKMNYTAWIPDQVGDDQPSPTAMANRL